MVTFNRRTTLKLGLGVAGAALGPKILISGARADTVKLVNVEHDSRTLDNAAYAAVYKAFREKHPDIEIDFQIIPWEQARSKLLTQAQGDVLPDMGRNSWVADFAAADMLVPIEDRVDPKTLERFNPVLIDQAKGIGTDGQKHLYGLPWFAGVQSILVNKTMFEAAGIQLKDNWTTEEFTECCKALTIPGKQWGVALDGSGVGDPVQIFLMAIYAYGGRWVKGDPQAAEPEPIIFDSEQTVAGITWYSDLYRAGYAVPSAPSDTYKERDANFQAGKAAIEWQGPWSLIETKEIMRKGGWEIASMPLPQGPAGAFAATFVAGLSSLYRTARKNGHEDQAFAWVDFLSSDQGQRIYCQTNGMIPASLALQNEAYWADNPIYKGYLSTMRSTKVIQPIWASGLDALLDDIVPPLLQGVLLGKLSPADTAKQIQEQVISGLRQNGVNVPAN